MIYIIVQNPNMRAAQSYKQQQTLPRGQHKLRKEKTKTQQKETIVQKQQTQDLTAIR